MAAFDEIFGAPPGSYPFHANAELAASRRCASYAIAMNGSSWPIGLHRRATL
jgi:hypothetical protein